MADWIDEAKLKSQQASARWAAEETQRQRNVQQQRAWYEANIGKIDAIYSAVDSNVQRAARAGFSVKTLSFSISDLNCLQVLGKDSSAGRMILQPVMNGLEAHFYHSFGIQKIHYTIEQVSEPLILKWIKWVADSNVSFSTRKFR